MKRDPADPGARAMVPGCPHYPKCVGCPLIDLPYARQLERKRAIVDQALAPYSSLRGVMVPRVVPSPQRVGYRSRVKLVVRRTGSRIVTGLYAPSSHRVIDISSCPVHPRPVNQVLNGLKKKLAELSIVPYDEREDRGDLRYLDFRYSASRREMSVTLVTRHDSFPQGRQLARALMGRFSFITGVIQNINVERGNVIWGRRYRTLGGRDTIMDRMGDLTLAFPAGVFSQANPFAARKIYDYVRSLASLGGRETVLDLYCGVGPLALWLAPQARQVWGIDESEISVAAAKQNARRNGRGNCRFFSGDVARELARLPPSLSGIDLAILNPPRKGMEPAALAALVERIPQKLIYVSCEPRSLARDLDRLAAAGYRVADLQPFDMFPQTEQIETVVQLSWTGNV